MPKNELKNTRFPNSYSKTSTGSNQGKVSGGIVFKGKGGVYPGMKNPK
jgi:hypothetical protein